MEYKNIILLTATIIVILAVSNFQRINDIFFKILAFMEASLKIYKKPYVELQFPFDPKQGVKCTQGNLNFTGSHSYSNTIFAVDLQSINVDSRGEIFAAEEGKAYVYDLCNDNSENNGFNVDDCGNGFGNHVRILHSNGYLTMYAHLSKVFISNGQYVKKGEKIGLEGNSGKSGKKHLHFSAHKQSREDVLQNIGYIGWTGSSSPFIFKIRYSNNNKIIYKSSTEFKYNKKYGDIVIFGVWD